MKVGILTLSASDNCGSLLQAYALQEIIKQFDHEVEIINFVNPISRKMYRNFHPGYIRTPKKFVGMLRRYPRLINQTNDYERFRLQYLRLSDQKFTNQKDLEKLDGKYDIVISGSDQVWNVYMRDFDPAYFLSWCKKSGRVSYAASLGDQKNGRCEDMLGQGFTPSEFRAISVREASSQAKLKKELNVEAALCLDPTLLLDKTLWKEMVNREIIPKEEYVFYYSYNYADDIKNQLVKEFAQKKNLPVYVINESRWIDGKEKKFGFQIFQQAGPLAFINLMYGCKYSLVESFHGTIFSHIFQRPFWFLKNAEDSQLDDRINDLMTVLGTKDRVLAPGRTLYNDRWKADYGIESDNLKKLKEDSQRFLQNSLQEG
jgi:hypothetical protein